MAEVRVATRSEEVGRLGTVAAWISAAACLPYLFLKVVWTLDVPVGITDRSVLHSGRWVAGNAVMALVQIMAVGLVLALVRPWSRMVPTWIVLLPVWVGTGLLFQIMVGSVVSVLSSAASQDSGTELGGIAPWVYVLVYTAFAVQGVALAVAFAFHVRARWGRLLAARTGDLITIPSRRSWPQVHLVEIARVVAVMALVVALVCAYWAAGGSYGLSDARAHDIAGMQVSRATGAVIAAAGVLGLAGQWGRERPFWLPAALTWVGSGALVAFDVLTVVVNRLFYVFGSPPPEADWAPADTLLVIKVLVGVLAAVVGVLVVRSAAHGDDRGPIAPVPGRSALHPGPGM
jgi:hypothetical protein